MSSEKTKKKRKKIFPFLTNSIRNNLIFYFALIILTALILFMIISLNFTQNTILNNSTNYTSQLVSQVNSEIDSYIRYMENISQMVTYNADINDYLFDQRNINYSTERGAGRIGDFFGNIMDARQDVSNIAVISMDGRAVVNDGSGEINHYLDLDTVGWFVEAGKQGGKTVLSSSHVQNVIMDNYLWVVTLSKALRNPYTEQIEAIFFIDLNYNAISSLGESIDLGSKGYLYIIDEQGNIVYHPQQQLLYSGLKDELVDEILKSREGSFLTGVNEEKLYTISRSENTGWTVVGVVSVAELMEDKKEIQMIYILMTAILLSLSLVCSVILSEKLTMPIKKLTQSMKEVEKGNFDVVTDIPTSNNEIESMAKAFNIMTSEIKNLMIQNEEVQRNKRKSELLALQSQINPHFLYNTLDSIIWMAEWGKNKEVVLMTSSLAKLFRRSISNENEVIKIDHEIDYVNSYLTIQRMRYKDKLDFQIDVDEDILEYYIVKLVLQPLVENAIYHGIKYKDVKGLLTIKGWMEDNCVILQVIDDGIGMDEETIKSIFKRRNTDAKSGRVGVPNVQSRLQLFYGEEYGISYTSIPGKGTTATVKIPACQEDSYEKK